MPSPECDQTLTVKNPILIELELKSLGTVTKCVAEMNWSSISLFFAALGSLFNATGSGLLVIRRH